MKNTFDVEITYLPT